MATKFPKVWILILTWNNYEDTRKCLDSISTLDYPNYEVIVVDNYSTDGSIQKLQNEFPQYKYILNKQNFKFSGGVNKGIEIILNLKEDGYIFLLNNDTIINNKIILQSLVSVMEQNHNVGVLGARAIYPDGSNQTDLFFLKFPSIYSFIARISFIGRVYRKLSRKFREQNKVQNPIQVDWVPIGISLIRKNVFMDCRFDNENFPMDFSDVDFCKQVSIKTNYKILYCPYLTIIHRNGFPDSDKKIQNNFLRAKTAEIRYIRKYFSKRYTVLYKLLNFVNSLIFVIILSPLLFYKKYYTWCIPRLKNHLTLLREIWRL